MRNKLVIGLSAGALALVLAGGAASAATASQPVASAQASAALQPTAPAQQGQGLRRGQKERAGALLAGVLIKETAKATSLKPREVLAQLWAGKSLTQIAQSKGKTADAIIAAARTDTANRLKTAVSNGRLTQQQADQMLARFDQEAPKVMADTALGQKIGRRLEARAKVGVAAALIRATADVTGLTPAEIRAELKAGKSLAQIAQSKGKTGDDILAALKKRGEDRLTKLLDKAKDLINQPGLGGGSQQPAPQPQP